MGVPAKRPAGRPGGPRPAFEVNFALGLGSATEMGVMELSGAKGAAPSRRQRGGYSTTMLPSRATSNPARKPPLPRARARRVKCTFKFGPSATQALISREVGPLARPLFFEAIERFSTSYDALHFVAS